MDTKVPGMITAYQPVLKPLRIVIDCGAQDVNDESNKAAHGAV